MPTGLYEHPAWQAVPDQAMRPGGLALTRQALSYFDLMPDARILDVGCGAGGTLNYLTAQGERIGFGIDVSLELLRRARRNQSIAGFSCARVECLPLQDTSIDVILAECTLSIFEIETALHECARTLKPGGFLITSDLYARNENGKDALRQLPVGACISSAMSQAQVLEKITRCGMDVLLWQDCSEKLKEFPITTLINTAEVDPFDLHIAAARARIGYYLLVARKVRDSFQGRRGGFSCGSHSFFAIG
ncbi:MAG: DVU_1556 family methyltransferase [Chloroflexota bacterium]